MRFRLLGDFVIILLPLIIPQLVLVSSYSRKNSVIQIIPLSNLWHSLVGRPSACRSRISWKTTLANFCSDSWPFVILWPSRKQRTAPKMWKLVEDNGRYINHHCSKTSLFNHHCINTSVASGISWVNLPRSLLSLSSHSTRPQPTQFANYPQHGCL